MEVIFSENLLTEHHDLIYTYNVTLIYFPFLWIDIDDKVIRSDHQLQRRMKTSILDMDAKI